MAEDNDDTLGDVCLDEIPEAPQRIIPDPAFPIRAGNVGDPFGGLSAEELQDILDQIEQDQNIMDNSDGEQGAGPPPNAVEEAERPPEAARRPCNPDGTCPPGFICQNGFCVPDPNLTNNLGRITEADGVGINRSGTGDSSPSDKLGLDSESQSLKDARERFEKTRFIPEFPGGSQFRFFTSASKKMNIFLPQSENLYKKGSDAVSIKELKDKFNKITSFKRVIEEAISQARGYEGGLEIRDIIQLDYFIPLFVENLTPDFDIQTGPGGGMGMPAATRARNYFELETIPLRTQLTEENIQLRIFIPTYFINEHSNLFAEYFATLEEQSFNSLYGEDFNIDGTVKNYPDVSFAAQLVSSFNKERLVRLFISVLFQQSMKVIEKLPDLYGAAASSIIDGLVASANSGVHSTKEIEKYFRLIIDDSDLSWTLDLGEDFNPAAYNIMLPSDYNSTLFYQYLTQKSLMGGSFPNVAGKAHRGFDTFRQAMGLHFVSVVQNADGEEKRENPLALSNSAENIEVSTNLFGAGERNFISRGPGLYYPGAAIMSEGSKHPIKINKIRVGDYDYQAEIDPTFIVREELPGYSGAILPTKRKHTDSRPYVISRGNSKWKSESHFLLNDRYRVDPDSDLSSVLTNTKEYFRVSYDSGRLVPIDSHDSIRRARLVNTKMKPGLSFRIDDPLYDQLLDDFELVGDLVNRLNPYANQDNLGTDKQEDIRNYLALHFNFRNWLYGFGVHPYFGAYKNIRREAQKKLVIENSYGTSEFYSKFMPLGRFAHTLGEDYNIIDNNPDRRMTVPLFDSYYSWPANTYGTINARPYYNPSPVKEEVNASEYSLFLMDQPDQVAITDLREADGNGAEFGKLVASRSNSVIETPYSTNLFPVIPFYSAGAPIEYLEGEHPYINIPYSCMYSADNYIENEDYTSKTSLENNELLSPFPEWDDQNLINRPSSVTDLNRVLGGAASYNNLAGIVTTGGGSTVTDENGNYTYRIAPNLQSVPHPREGERVQSLEFTGGGGLFYDDENRQTYNKENLNEDYFKSFAPLMNHPLINPNLAPPTAGEEAVFQDFYTEIPLCLNKKELKETFQIKINDHFDIEPVYNFYNSSYENLISDVDHSRIPTPYLVIDQNMHNDHNDFSSIEQALSEGGKNTVYNKLLPENVKKDSFFFNTGNKRFKEIFGEKNKIPMYVQMELSSKHKSVNGFVSALSKAQLKTVTNESYYSVLLRKLASQRGQLSGARYEPSLVLTELSQFGNISNQADNTIKNPRVLDYYLAKDQISLDGLETALSRHKQNIVSNITGRVDGVDVSAIRTMPFEQWLDSIDVPGNLEGLNDADLSLDDILLKFISKKTMIQKIKNLVDDKKRSMEEVFSGIPAYSETVAFKVVKYEIDSDNLEKISDTETIFYFSNVNEEDIIKFFDSQVQYGKLYRYEMYRVIATIGTKYGYFDNNSQGTINHLYLKSSPAGAITYGEMEELCLKNPLLAAQLSFITLKTAMKLLHQGQVAQEGVLGGAGAMADINTIEGRRYEQAHLRAIRTIAGSGGVSRAYIANDLHSFAAHVEQDVDLLKADPLYIYATTEFRSGQLGQFSREGPVFDYFDTNNTFQEQRNKDTCIYFGTISRPDVKIMEVLDRSRNIAVLDKPPVPPETEIHPVLGNQRNILLSFRTGLGEHFDNPIILEDDDYEQFKISAYAQGIDGSIFDSDHDDIIGQPMLHFKSDDKSRFFEIFRIDQPPESWEDFYNFKIARIGTDNGIAQMYDSIIPNKEYYYTFRSEDRHGHVSNPGQIYRVINHVVEQGSRLEKELYRFDSDKKLLNEKRNFNRFLEIKPSIENRRVNIEYIQDEPQNGEVYGTSTNHFGIGTNMDHKPWGKKFKVRLTSKSTGRQIEVNINYQVVYNKDGDPEETIIVSDYIGDLHRPSARENVKHKVVSLLRKAGLLKEKEAESLEEENTKY